MRRVLRGPYSSRLNSSSMDFNDAANLARALIAEHGLSDWSFRFNHGKRTLGLCHYDGKRIELSRYFVARNDQAAVRDTILHEIAHALAGPKVGHGPAWRAICLKIGAAPKRLDDQADMPKGRWLAQCPGCGQAHTRFRRPLRSRIYICRTCGPRKGKLRFKPATPSHATTVRS